MTVNSHLGVWFLFDYGMVISTAPEPGDWQALETATGLELRHATSPYWSHREGFDAGTLSADEYWSMVLGRPVGTELLELLEGLDATQWSHLNDATLQALEALRNEGASLALLSNMPEPMSRRYSAESPWTSYFARLFFSGQLGLAKPDSGIFDIVTAELQASAEDIVFIDDNAQNIATAHGLGFKTVHFDPAMNLLEELSAAVK